MRRKKWGRCPPTPEDDETSASSAPCPPAPRLPASPMNGAARRGAAVARDVGGGRKSGRDVDVKDRRPAPISPPGLVPAVLLDRFTPLALSLIPPCPDLILFISSGGLGGAPPRFELANFGGPGVSPAFSWSAQRNRYIRE